MRQIPLAIAPLPRQTFDDFLPGANAAALAHLRTLSSARPAAPAQGSAPVYLWGPRGSGKTHLLRALAEAAHARGQRVAWFDPARDLPWHVDAHCGWILLDDTDAFDEDQQQAAFALFVEAGTQGIQVAATGAVPPIDLRLRDDLRSRLGWGPVFGLVPLQEDDARGALRREADRRGIFLSDDVMDYLLTRFSRDLKHLMALLDRLDEFALSQRRPVTVPLLKQMFEQEGTTL